MANGYVGKLLFVDLTAGTTTVETPDEELYRKYIGGTGLGVGILFDRMKSGVDALGPDNMLGFTTGPLTGTGVYGGGRFTVVAKSPLTGAWADSNSGGTWGPELKFAGYDGVFFSGISPTPVYLVIEAGRAELKDAAHLWGKDTYEIEDLLQSELGGTGSWKIASIGPAGEECSLLAGIVNEKGRIAARSGVGAVMGSKKLKAIAVRGASKARMVVADKESLRTVQQKFGKDLKESPFHKGLSIAGTGGGTSFLLSIGDCPSKNWNTTGTESMPTCDNLDAGKMDKYKLSGYGCHTCPVRCGAIIKVDGGPYPTEDEVHRPEYETLAAFGPLCLNDSVEVIIKANEICNRYGIDTIGVGGTVAFAIECYETGVIGKDETDGLELTWGNEDAIVKLTEKIARREGFGALLADGATKAAERIGRGTGQYAMDVAGRALPLHDPRATPSIGAAYVADAQPANHMGPQGMSILDMGEPLGPDPLLQPEALDPFGDYDRKGDIYAKGSAYYQLLSSAGLCALYCQFYTPPVVELIRPVTGWDLDWKEGLEIGKRILTLRQAFNAREGVRPDDFQLPERFKTPLGMGPTAGQDVPFTTLKERYFTSMGWDPETGVPLPETMAALEVG